MKKWICWPVLTAALMALSSCAKEKVEGPEYLVTTISATGLENQSATLIDVTGKTVEITFDAEGVVKVESESADSTVLTSLNVGEDKIRLGRLTGSTIELNFIDGKLSGRVAENGDILIGTVDEFAAIMKNPEEMLASHYSMGADLYFDGVSDWIPIGDSFSTPFTGSFDGCGHKISNFELSPVAEEGDVVKYTGIFGITQDATISNLTLASGKINGYRYTAGIVARMSGNAKLTNCHNYAEITGEETYTGGVAGQFMGDLVSCSNHGKVYGRSTVGGVVAGATIRGSHVSDCVNYGDVHCAVGEAGGVVGSNSAHLENCVNKGFVSGNSSVGGVAGSVSQDTLKTCFNEGKVTGMVQGIGGICGSIGQRGVLYGCSNRGEVCGEASVDSDGNAVVPAAVGGIVGNVTTSGYVQHCVNEENAVMNTGASTRVGGIAGFCRQGNIEYCVNNMNITAGGESAGGIIGFNNGLVAFCENNGTVTGTRFVGGISGFTESGIGKIRGCRNAGSVHGTVEFAGGITGIAWGTVSASSNVANVEGVNYVGGICGGVAGGMAYVVASYNRGAVKGTSTVGGAIGEARQAALVEASYAVASVSGESGCAGFCAVLDESSKIVASYWSGNSKSGIGTGTGAEGTSVKYFDDGIVPQANVETGWPDVSQSASWGVGNGMNSNWWKSLGTSGQASYPVLFWEE